MFDKFLDDSAPFRWEAGNTLCTKDAIFKQMLLLLFYMFTERKREAKWERWHKKVDIQCDRPIDR